MKILVVDDEEIQRTTIEDDLTDAGHKVKVMDSPIPALELIKREKFDVVLSDLKMPGMNGIEFFKEIKRINGELEVIIMTAYATVKTAVEAIRNGAYDYLTKPFEIDELLHTLSHLEKLKKLSADNVRLQRELKERYSFGSIIGKSVAMRKVLEQIEVVAPTHTTVLITGETGTGKEIMAETVHHSSLVPDGPLVKVSCAILSREILESELFGHEKGAFTSATNDKKGRFELADGGSIYLDDVDDIPLELQVKLLRVLEEKQIERVGGTKSIPINVRVIASTKKDLFQLSQDGKFRSDLFYRLNVFPITLPSIRERREDIPLLLEHFLKMLFPDRVPELDEKTVSILMDQPWTGNVREIKNLVERLSVVCKCDPIVPECLPIEMLEGHQTSYFTSKGLKDGPNLPESVAMFEIGLLREAMIKYDKNKEKVARMLGIPVSTLKSKLKKYDLNL